MIWQTSVYATCGPDHERRRLPCQDALVSWQGPRGEFCGVVCDGTGDSDLSQIAATRTATMIFNWLVSKIDPRTPPSDADLRTLFDSALNRAQFRLRELANSERLDIRKLTSTLVVFYATPEWAIAGQLGDGFIVVGDEAGRYSAVFTPRRTDVPGGTDVVVATSATKHLQVARIDSPVFVCISTDGLENVAITSPHGAFTPHRRFFEHLHFSPTPFDILDSDEARKLSGDDKAVIVGKRQELLQPPYERLEVR